MEIKIAHGENRGRFFVSGERMIAVMEAGVEKFIFMIQILWENEIFWQ